MSEKWWDCLSGWSGEDNVWSRLVTDSIVVSAGIVGVYLFGMFWRYGNLKLYEDNLAIRVTETFLCAAVLIWGLYNVITHMRKIGK